MKNAMQTKSVNKNLRQATLCLLRQKNQVLLAMKKRGFGQGKWNGVGGKPNPGETIEETAIRETQEEIGVIPKNLNKVAVLNFLFPNTKKEWNQQVHVYLVDTWDGDPCESEEMSPQWFEIDQIPYESMWEDDKHWLPNVLNGQKLNATFIFDPNQNLTNFEISEELT
ncbi:MAG: 8-oxo-dGTP diphosphatase [Patescibacteria group bacterium]|nr:8-oxo-dGTP diphosphatase [Patescibacteria group bacterium]